MIVSEPLSLEEVERINKASIDAGATDIEEAEAALEDPVLDILRFICLMPGKRMLDVGCGSARYVRYFVRDGGLDYVGIDLSPAMLARAPSSIRSFASKK